MRIGWQGFAALAVSAWLISAPAGAVQPADAWITTKVKMSLLTAEGIDALSLNVDTFDGDVTLHGAVRTAEQKSQAEARANTIDGVKSVRNLLAVVPGDQETATAIADEKIRDDVSNVLARDAALEDSQIGVKSVNGGVVVLSGDAKTLSAHKRALEDARSVEGVTQVASEIQSPDELGDQEIWHDDASGEAAANETSLAEDGWITTKAKVRLMAEPGLSPMAINVDTRNGEVTLFGSVETEELKSRAEAQVAKIKGVRNVENELQVVPHVSAEKVETQDADILDAVEKRIGERESLGDANIDVEVSNATVRLTGTVASQSDRLTALTVARGTDQVDSVVDDLRVVPSTH